MKTTIHRRGTAAIAGVALCAFAPLAPALPPPPYAVVDIGSTRLGLDTTGIEDTGLETSGHDRRTTGFAITIGWRFTEHLAVEGSFLELGRGKFEVTDPDSVFGSPVRMRVGSTGILLAAAGTLPVHERLSLEARVGTYLGRTQTSVSGIFSSPQGGQVINGMLGSDTKAGLAAGVGAVFALNETWGLRAGYDYLDKAFGTDARRISLGVRFNWP